MFIIEIVLKKPLKQQTDGVFCAEHGIGFYSRVNYNGSFYTVTDPTMKKACKIAYFGWYQKYGDYVVGDNSVFNISGNNYNNNIEVKNGKITIDKLQKGTYYVKEVSAPNGYVINTETYKVEIKANQTTTQAIKNTEPTGEITLSKTDKYTGNSKRVNGTINHRDATLGVMLLAFLGIVWIL